MTGEGGELDMRRVSVEKSEKEKIMKELGGISEDIYDDLVQAFISQTGGAIAELKSVLSNGDFDSVAKIAHSIRGSAANLRFTRMQKIVETIEIAAKGRKDNYIPRDCITKLENALEQLTANK